jgi:hypothetical protein
MEFRSWIDTQGLIEYPGKGSMHIMKGITNMQVCKKCVIVQGHTSH